MIDFMTLIAVSALNQIKVCTIESASVAIHDGDVSQNSTPPKTFFLHRKDQSDNAVADEYEMVMGPNDAETLKRHATFVFDLEDDTGSKDTTNQRIRYYIYYSSNGHTTMYMDAAAGSAVNFMLSGFGFWDVEDEPVPGFAVQAGWCAGVE